MCGDKIKTVLYEISIVFKQYQHGELEIYLAMLNNYRPNSNNGMHRSTFVLQTLNYVSVT
jgi:Cdc6-like AAA superfamily ATPase